MAEGTPIDQANALTLKIQELEKKVAQLEIENRRLHLSVNDKEARIDRANDGREVADEVHQAIIDKLLARLEDR